MVKDAYNTCLLIITITISITVSEFLVTYQLKSICILLPHGVQINMKTVQYEGRTESEEQLFCMRTGNSRRRRVRW